jgi:hypothetical protein
MGTIAVDGSSDIRSEASALFVEYYTYQAPGEPKFVLQPDDSQWLEIGQFGAAPGSHCADQNVMSRSATPQPQHAGPAHDTRQMRTFPTRR